MVLSEGESTGARRTRPMERAKVKDMEAKDNVKANGHSEVTDNMEAKGRHRTRGRSKTRKNRSEVRMIAERQSSNETCDGWRNGGELKRSMS